jgi:NAD(P)-dependent dehydrogenase (short-subunit alcohol dehydrogenase family)
MRLFFLTIFALLTLCGPGFTDSVVITGANQGIGFGLVKHYLGEGYTVYATYRSKEKSQELLAINERNLIPILADFEQPNVALQNIKRVLKNEPLDILILNAGYFAAKANNFKELEPEDFQRSFTVNTISPLILAQGLQENLSMGATKKIVAITSRRGSIQQTKEERYTGRYGYRCSKTALNAGMSALALDMPDMIVLVLHPGRVSTAFTKFDPKGLSVEQSVRGITETISAATLSHSGKFYDYKGEALPW